MGSHRDTTNPLRGLKAGDSSIVADPHFSLPNRNGGWHWGRAASNCRFIGKARGDGGANNTHQPRIQGKRGEGNKQDESGS
eukprot:11867263-Karenia_brevis.AAC.1